MADIQNFVGFAQNERLIKEYSGFRMYSPVKAKINLSVTNKRLIVYSSVKNFFVEDQPSLFQQISISEIRGLEVIQAIRYNYTLLAGSVIALVAGIAASLAGSLVNSLPSVGTIIPLLGIVFCLVGVVGMIFFALRPNRIFRFIARGQAVDLNIGEFTKIAPVISSGPDLQGIVEELGALVIQIQDGTI
jgi:hypothetical protein